MIFSFSGVDGAGKTAQLTQLTKKLKEENVSVRLKRIHDTSIYLQIGEFLKKWAPQSANSMVTQQFQNRSPKGLKKNMLRLVRQACHIIDLLRFYLTVYWVHKDSKEVVLCDRYFPDLLVHMLYVGMCSEFFLRTISKWAPPCKSSFLLLDSVENILSRKKPRFEDLNYYYGKDKLYRQMVNHFNLEVIENKSLEEVSKITYGSIMRFLKPRPDKNVT